MVNGQPVCDDGSEAHRAATAGVVCRFLMLSNDALQLTIINFTDFLPSILLPRLFMKSLFLVLLIFYIFLPQSPIFYFRELGYVRASQETMESHFGQVSDEFAMDDVQCTGNETSIFDCPHQTIDNCGGSEGLGVICSGDTIYD